MGPSSLYGSKQASKTKTKREKLELSQITNHKRFLSLSQIGKLAPHSPNCSLTPLDIQSDLYAMGCSLRDYPTAEGGPKVPEFLAVQ